MSIRRPKTSASFHSLCEPGTCFTGQAVIGQSLVCVSMQVFDVDVVECWSLKQPEEEPQPSSRAGGSSILDTFKEDRHLMSMAGRATQASAGVREAPPEDEL